jgi:hypothetical protein
VQYRAWWIAVILLFLPSPLLFVVAHEKCLFSSLAFSGRLQPLLWSKVSQDPVVLARRCASIEKPQQHLLRAGWQRGVAQWGVLDKAYSGPLLF